jgi:hypothetical protein
MIVLCPATRFTVSFLFVEEIATGIVHLEILQNRLIPQLNEDSGVDLTYQQNGAPLFISMQ